MNQIPGSTMYGLALYFMTKTPLEETPILKSFVNGDDAYRNSRFKLIPYISKVSITVVKAINFGSDMVVVRDMIICILLLCHLILFG